MKAFHGKQSVKDFYINRMKGHMEFDELIRGTYWDEASHSGCAVGCLLERSEDVHAQFEPELGIPSQLAYLEDHLFENTPTDYYKTFPLAFLEAIPVGANLSRVTPRFLVWLLLDEQDGVIRFADEQGRKVISLVAGLYQRSIDGGEVADSEWDAARVAASDAARAAARDAARVAARVAARAAAWEAAREAAWDAAWEAAWEAASDAATKRQAEKLLELLRDAPVAVEAE